jgi:hypothetical protein
LSSEAAVRWDSRLSALEWIAADVVDADERIADYQAAADRYLVEMLAHIPGPILLSVTDAIGAGGPVGESLREWLHAPFKVGSPPVTADLRFPISLVEFLLHPPRDYWIGHSCKACGLMVPVFLTWANDPDPPPVLKAFPVCPSCAEITGYT